MTTSNLNPRLREAIREANLSYLVLAQTMLREDRLGGMFRLGLTEESALVIESLTASQLVRIASGSSVVAQFRFSDEMVWSLLSEHAGADGESGERNSRRLHASILTAGHSAQSV